MSLAKTSAGFGKLAVNKNIYAYLNFGWINVYSKMLLHTIQAFAHFITTAAATNNYKQLSYLSTVSILEVDIFTKTKRHNVITESKNM